MNVQLISGDCIPFLRSLPAGSIDAIVTDTPYGVGVDYGLYDDTEDNWYKLIHAVLPEMRRVARCVVLPSCQIKRLKWWYATYPPDWVIAWYKGSPGHQSAIGFNDWEPYLVYGRPPRAMHDFFESRCGFEVAGHPCPKPLSWATWLVQRVALRSQTVLDPFMGSGTVGVACAQLGRNFIGCELNPAFYELAESRIALARTQAPLLAIEDEADDEPAPIGVPVVWKQGALF